MPNYDITTFVSDPYGDGSSKSSSSKSSSSGSSGGEKRVVVSNYRREGDPPPKGSPEPRRSYEPEEREPQTNYKPEDREPAKKNYEPVNLEPEGGQDKTSTSSTSSSEVRRRKKNKAEQDEQNRSKELLGLATRPRQLGPFPVQVRPVCGRTGGGPQRLVARTGTWRTFELGKHYKGENILALWHTFLYENRRQGERRWMYATLDEDTQTTVSVRYLRAHDNLGDLPEAERPLYDRDRYKVTVQGGKLHYRGQLMDTTKGEAGRYIYVMSPEGDFYAADVRDENITNGIGPWLKKLDEAAKKLDDAGWTFRLAGRQAPTDRYQKRPTSAVTCALQALDRDPGCAGALQPDASMWFVMGVKSHEGSPIGVTPTSDLMAATGVELFKDLPEGGAWVCDACYRRRGRETLPDGKRAPKWPLVSRPSLDWNKAAEYMKRPDKVNEIFSLLDALEDQDPGLAKRVIPALRAAATEELAKQAKEDPSSPTRKVTLLHHSSLLAGGPVACAGGLGVKEGVLHYIDNNSGHYSPPRPLLVQALARLFALGADMKKVEVHTMDGNKYYDFPDDWHKLRPLIGDLDDPEALVRGYQGPDEDRLAQFRRALAEYIGQLRRSANLVARPPNAPPVPCATEGCGATSTAVLGDDVGETFLCQKCLDARLLGKCEQGGCTEPSAHEVQEEGGGTLHLCQKHFQERHVIKCSETGCAKTSKDSVMDVISRSFFCKAHFTEAMEGMGVKVCSNAECTETAEVQLVNDQPLCKAHR